MVVYYKVFGLLANIALLFNLVIVVAVMSLIGATLTLPGMTRDFSRFNDPHRNERRVTRGL